ncbi:MAG: hypothetical protein H6704_07890 [Myxococcales bacterium]|nr:hypothetical protein [Myxococcales bacterium]
MPQRSRREFLALAAGGLLAAPLVARAQPGDEEAEPADDGAGKDEASQAIILDYAGGELRIGLAGDDAPRAVMPGLVGRPRHPGVTVGMGQKDAYVGDEAVAKRTLLTLKYPIEHGVVVDWPDLEKVWHHAFFNELRVAPEDHPVLLSEAPIASKQSRETTAKIMFEAFNVPGLSIAPDGVLALYAEGRTTGLVVMKRGRLGWAEPIYEGVLLRHAVVPLALTQQDVAHAPGALLAPQAIHQAIQRCDPALRADLYAGIVLAGNGTTLDGLQPRLTAEVSALAPPGAAVKVHASPGRAHAVWSGASALASLDAFQPMWVTRDAYAKRGAAAVHAKIL